MRCACVPYMAYGGMRRLVRGSGRALVVPSGAFEVCAGGGNDRVRHGDGCVRHGGERVRVGDA